ncbi:MAG: hypothetical protein ACJAT7_000941 [Psychromonas sp.]|jgi:uncharacterized protein YggE|uniref:SIMPL domain-containing protein n=1 Tax=Psychromonas sp. TaxID=1884585 RepID=UPI0039E4FB50
MRYWQYLLITVISVFCTSSLADSIPDAPSISVTGSAELEVTPDQVIIKFHASAIEPSGTLAKSRVDQQVSTLLANLKKAGFNSEKLESADLYIRAEYDYQKDKRTLLGIRATRDLTYLLTDINKVSHFLDALLSANIDSIEPLQYGLQSPDAWQLKVRLMAVDDSMEKGSVLAQAYKSELGKIYSVNYQDSYSRPVMMRTMQSEMAATTYQIKKIKLSDRVQAVFLLKP